MQNRILPLCAPNKLFCFLLLVFPIMLLSIFISCMLYQNEKEHQEVLHKNEEKHTIEQQQYRLEKLFFNITSDLKFLAASYQEYFKWKSRNNFSEILLLFSQHRQIYDQIRLLNKKGMEQIRVNLIAGSSVLLPEEKLQNKRERYYFQDTMKLNPGEIFISRFDLNVEHGEIETPYKPMLRFGTPVVDRKGNKQGAVILNYLGQEILDQIAEYEKNRIHGKLMLLNQEGYWLYGEQQEDAWAFMWSERAGNTFAARYPDAWQAVAAGQSGQFKSNGDFFTFTTLYPLSSGMSSSRIPDIFGSSREPIKAGEYYWKLLSRLSIKQIKQDHLTPFKYSLLLFNLILFTLLGPIGWLLISFHASREKTRRKLNHFKNVLDQTLDCVFMFDPNELRFTYVNQGAQSQTGYTEEELLHMTPLSIKPEYTEAEFRKMMTPLKAGKIKNLFVQTVHQHKKGARIPVEIHLQYIEPAGDTPCFIAVVRDITERRQAEEALKAAHHRLLTVLNSIDAMVYVIDLDSYELLFINKYAVDIFGDITGSVCWKSLQKGLDGPCDFCPNELLRSRKGYADRTYTWERKNPFNNQWYEMHDRVIKWLNGRSVKIQIATDITERRQMEHQLQHNAYHDCLTGLANRRFFYDRVRQELSAAKRKKSKLGMIFIDLNHFKPVNDKYGHDAGDLLLQEVAHRLLKSVRKDDLVARMGGDEFVLLLPGIQTRDDLLQTSCTINKILSSPFRLTCDIEVTVSAAMGTAIYPDDGMLADDLLSVADQVMYRCKQRP